MLGRKDLQKQKQKLGEIEKRVRYRKVKRTRISIKIELGHELVSA